MIEFTDSETGILIKEGDETEIQGYHRLPIRVAFKVRQWVSKIDQVNIELLVNVFNGLDFGNSAQMKINCTVYHQLSSVVTIH